MGLPGHGGFAHPLAPTAATTINSADATPISPAGSSPTHPTTSTANPTATITTPTAAVATTPAGPPCAGTTGRGDLASTQGQESAPAQP
eukprot:49501-Eustigmatos_ZCMA.PRE.1